MEYDQTKSFIEQLLALRNKTPHPHQFGSGNTNCDYSDDVWQSKDCYLCRSQIDCERLHYGYRNVRIRDSLDITYCYDVERSYECTYSKNLYQTCYAFDARSGSDCAFLYDCRNVQNCFMCWNLRGKSYHIKNKPLGKDEYARVLESYHLDTWTGRSRAAREFNDLLKREAIIKTDFNVNVENSSGNFMQNCKDCFATFFWEDSENVRRSWRGLLTKDAIYSHGTWDVQLGFQLVQITTGANLHNAIFCTNCRDSEYLIYCYDCSDCFGCVGLRKGKFCILNKPYPEAEYRALVAQIKDSLRKDGALDQFFPGTFSYTGYNKSLAGVYYPLTKDQVIAGGWMWEPDQPVATKGIPASELPDAIGDIPDDITKKVITCEKSGRPFKIIPQELKFYRDQKIPLPRLHPDERNLARFTQMPATNPRDVPCFSCHKPTTTYFPESWGYQKFACTDCYLALVA